jgi:hypothetical protein
MQDRRFVFVKYEASVVLPAVQVAGWWGSWVVLVQVCSQLAYFVRYRVLLRTWYEHWGCWFSQLALSVRLTCTKLTLPIVNHLRLLLLYEILFLLPHYSLRYVLCWLYHHEFKFDLVLTFVKICRICRLHILFDWKVSLL